jgi:aromatic-L-amino-acid decarboxylase
MGRRELNRTLLSCAPEDGQAGRQSLVTAINDDGRLYVTQTRVESGVAIRFQTGSMEKTEQDVDLAFEIICGLARKLI